ncbi:MAG: phage holin family protein [Pseudarcicella sp.]|nr:phage holin family protein [Pseudarcicella sp.]MBP6409620.1 phage holin family protein [Pseudarcicella sp.]
MDLSNNHIIENFYRLFQTKIEITKLEIQEKVENTSKKLFLIIAIVSIALMSFLFLLIGIALYINTIIGNPFGGFLIIALILALASGIFYNKNKHNLK